MERRSTSSIGQMFRIIGFLSVLLFALGLAKKAGIQISLTGTGEMVQEDSFLSASAATPSETKEGDVLVLRPETGEEESGYRPSRSYASTQRNSSRPAVQAGDWVDRFSGTAVMQALNRGIPAGISLAVGLSKLQSGVPIDSWNDFMEQVIEPLAGLKQEDRLKDYFKYSANSDRWVEGLDRSGQYSAGTLRGLLSRHRLGDFDEMVRDKLVTGREIDPEVERKARAVADEVTAERRERRSTVARDEPAAPPSSDRVREWESVYDEVVGTEVAREVARKKLRSGQYITEEDMDRLINETNSETEEVLQQNLAFPGRRINRDHPEAEGMLDITDPRNAQAREELYQRKLRERGGNYRKKPD